MVSLTRRRLAGRRAAPNDAPPNAASAAAADGAPSTPGIVVRGVGKAFGELTVLDDVSFEVPLHQRIAIVGPSGCGKSTLLSVVAGLQDADAGLVSTLGGSTPRERLASC